MEWDKVVSALLGLAGFIFVLFKWFQSWSAEKHKAHEIKFHDHAQKIERNEYMVSKTREELHRDFVRTDQLARMEEHIIRQIDGVHKRLGGIAKDLNQVIGEVKVKREGDG